MEPLLSVDKVAELLDLDRSTVNKLINSGRLEAVNVGAAKSPRYKVKPAKLDEFIASRTTGAPVPKPTPTRRRKRKAAVNHFPDIIKD